MTHSGNAKSPGCTTERTSHPSLGYSCYLCIANLAIPDAAVDIATGPLTIWAATLKFEPAVYRWNYVLNQFLASLPFLVEIGKEALFFTPQPQNLGQLRRISSPSQFATMVVKAIFLWYK